MVTGTNIITAGHLNPFTIYGLGFIVILVYPLFKGRRRGSVIGTGVNTGALFVLWFWVGGMMTLFSVFVADGLDGWENEKAKEEDREVRLYDGGTAPVVEEETPIPEVEEPTGHAYIPCEWVDPRDRDFGNCTW